MCPPLIIPPPTPSPSHKPSLLPPLPLHLQRIHPTPIYLTMFKPIVTSEERTTKRQPYAGLGFSEWDPGMWENSKKIVRNEQEITGNGLISCRKTEAVRIRWLYEEELRKASPLGSGVTGVACWQYASSHPPLAGNEACSSIKTILMECWQYDLHIGRPMRASLDISQHVYIPHIESTDIHSAKKVSSRLTLFDINQEVFHLFVH